MFTLWPSFRTGVLAGMLISNDKLGELKNWLGEKGKDLIGVIVGDSNGFIPDKLLVPYGVELNELGLIFCNKHNTYWTVYLSHIN